MYVHVHVVCTNCKVGNGTQNLVKFEKKLLDCKKCLYSYIRTCILQAIPT